MKVPIADKISQLANEYRRGCIRNGSSLIIWVRSAEVTASVPLCPYSWVRA
jgi:hypothetical protein